MIDTESFKLSTHRISLFSGMILEYNHENLTEKERRYKNIIIDKLIKEIVILNNILGRK